MYCWEGKCNILFGELWILVVSMSVRRELGLVFGGFLCYFLCVDWSLTHEFLHWLYNVCCGLPSAMLGGLTVTVVSPHWFGGCVFPYALCMVALLCLAVWSRSVVVRFYLGLCVVCCFVVGCVEVASDLSVWFWAVLFLV